MATINGISNTGAPAPVSQKSKVRTETSEGSTTPTKTSGDSLVLTDILAKVNAVSGFDASKDPWASYNVSGINKILDNVLDDFQRDLRRDWNQ